MSAQATTAADPATPTENQRERFSRLLPRLLAEDDRLAAVLAEIGVNYLAEAPPPIADRIVNVGIREQLLIGVAGGLALAGMRPIVHTFPSFLIERPWEQVKLDLGHQDVGAVLVSAGASYDWPKGGETHFGHRDVALLDTLAGWTVHVPGHPDEAEALLRAALPGDDRIYLRLASDGNARPLGGADGRLRVLRRGSRATVIAVGPLADRTLAATAGLDVTVLYAATVRPFDAETLRATLDTPDVVIIEPYLRGTSSAVVAEALRGVRHRVLGLGVGRDELRRYGTPAEHDAVHGIDEAGLRRAVTAFVTELD
ncbi:MULTISPECIES: transketolase family protein [Actinoalloteichus]|uniref:Transketolase, alpha subunit n=1 Tax=Actinoalloteichus fjordicus TaxID=1612552 RepID=A0AAC9LE81_9PSEU|nr:MULTISPECIES: transketolase C-terminal domain-containing protein [Actinoalloteichus]APU15761.1 transketolase, alpha subunit [Actinoalloteichus fjordicus]APU21821.1 transketolase, alpha subunit [Actinoalloteichus sp. GBA129-24]